MKKYVKPELISEDIRAKRFCNDDHIVSAGQNGWIEGTDGDIDGWNENE